MSFVHGGPMRPNITFLVIKLVFFSLPKKVLGSKYYQSMRFYFNYKLKNRFWLWSGAASGQLSCKPSTRASTL